MSNADNQSQDNVIARVEYFGPGDLSYGWQMERIEALCSKEIRSFHSINDAIEIRQCYLILSKALNQDAQNREPYQNMLKNSQNALPTAFKFIGTRLQEDELPSLIRELEVDYYGALFEVISAGNLDKNIDPHDLDAVLKDNPCLLNILLKNERMTKGFGSSIREAMKINPEISAETIIRAKALSKEHLRETIFLPSELSDTDVNSIFNLYINSDTPNPNYLEVIVRWRDNWGFNISSSTKLAASLRNRECLAEVQEDGLSSKFSYGVGVAFDETQEPCIRISTTEGEPLFIYGAQWFHENQDFETILNNFIYIFLFADRHCLIEVAKPDRNRSLFLDTLGVKTKDEYRIGFAYSITEMRTLATLRGYCELLKRDGNELEDVIEWYFNSYLRETYGIAGFKISLEKEGSFLSKCRNIGPEIESALKGYQLFSNKKEISPEALHFETFSSFQGLPSQIEQKYIYGAEEEYQTASYLLFSDQCMLSYSPNDQCNYKNFFERIRKSETYPSSLPEYETNHFKWLLDRDFIVLENGVISATDKAKITYKIWRNGCIVFHRETSDNKAIVNKYLEEGYLKAESTLLSQSEAAYFSFTYHDRDYSNAAALRNAYLHGDTLANDPNDERHRINYDRFLLLFIYLILKIEDELSQCSNDEAIELVDWPLYEIDQNALEALKIKNRSETKK